MNTEEILKTAHIHIESATLRVHIDSIDKYDTNKMSEDELKPDFVMWVSKSHDYDQKKDSLLVEVVGEWDLNILAEWVKKYEQ